MNRKLMHYFSLLLLFAIPGSSLVIFQNCGSGLKSQDLSSAANICKPLNGSEPIDKNYEVIPGSQTVSIAYGRQVLDSMIACTGLGTPSARAENEWQTRNQSLSEYGSATEVSGAMMMAIAAVAGEVCRDLVDKEKTLAPASRAFFGSSDLAGNSLNSAQVESAVDMFALSCWQRTASAEEKSIVVTSINEMQANADLSALSVCTAALSSLAAVTQ